MRGIGFGYQEIATHPKGVFVEPFLATFEVKSDWVSPVLSLGVPSKSSKCGQLQNPDPVPRREFRTSTAMCPRPIFTSLSERVVTRIKLHVGSH